MAGHSKWAQIKHKKAITDAKKGARFSKLVQEVQVAARVGGTNPDGNPRLRTALSKAREAGLTKEVLDRATMRANGGNETKLEEFLYEATAPGGIMIIIEGITDSTNRTHAELKHLLSLHNAQLEGPGSVLWNFQKIGILEFSKTNATGKSNDDIELAAIDAGATDIKTEENRWNIETVFEQCDTVRKNLGAGGISPCTTSHEYRSKSPLTITEKSLRELEPLFEALIDHDDVLEVYTNIAE